MKACASLLAIVVMLSGTSALRDDVVLTGILSTGDVTFVILADKDTKTSSPWLKEGQTWRDYRVSSIDRQAGRAFLVRGERTITVNLKER